MVFAEGYKRLAGDVEVEAVLVKAGVRIEEGTNPKITAAEIMPLEEAKVPLPRAIRVRIPLETSEESTIDNLHNLFVERKGEARVLFDVERQGDFMVVMEAEGYNVFQTAISLPAWSNYAGAAASASSAKRLWQLVKKYSKSWN